MGLMMLKLRSKAREDFVAFTVRSQYGLVYILNYSRL